MIVTFARPAGSFSDVRTRWGKRKRRKWKTARASVPVAFVWERTNVTLFTFRFSRQSGKTCCYNKRATCNESKIRERKKEKRKEKRAAQENESVSWGELCRCCSPFFASLLIFARIKIAWKRSPSRSTVANVEFLTLAPNLAGDLYFFDSLIKRKKTGME